MLIKWFYLFSGGSTKKIRKSLVLIKRKAMGMSLEKQKRFNEDLRTRKVGLKAKRVHDWLCTRVQLCKNRMVKT